MATVVITYNRQDLGYVLTQSIDQSPEYDDSGTDMLYTRTRITVRAIMAANLPPAVGSESAGDVLARVKHVLTLPRCPLTYKAGGATIFDIQPDGGSTGEITGAPLDDEMGPKVIFCNVTPMGTASFLVNFSVEFRLADCALPDADAPAYLSNRWTEVVTIDERQLTVRRKTGVLILSSQDSNKPDDDDPDEYRDLVTPAVYPGFRRELAEYSLSPNGLRISYTFLDRELMASPPFNMIRLKGYQSEVTEQGGGKRIGDIYLRGEGEAFTFRRSIFDTLITIAMQRMYQSGPVSDGNGKILITGSVRESLNDDENVVEVHLRWMLKPQRKRTTPNVLGGVGKLPPMGGGKDTVQPSPFGPGGLGPLAPFAPLVPIAGAGPPVVPNADGNNIAAWSTPVPWLGQQLYGTDDSRTIAPGTRGIAGIRLAAAALQDPCGQTAEFATEELTGDSEQIGTTPDGATVTASVTNSDVDSFGDTDLIALYEDEQGPDESGVYEFYELVAAYTDTSGDVVMPPTGVGENANVGTRVKVLGSQVKLRLTYSASRVGARPALPSTDLGDNWVFTKRVRGIDGFTLAADGVSVKYVVSGAMEFTALDADQALESEIIAPIPPFLRSSDLKEKAASAVALVVDDIMDFDEATVNA